jgi:hypothetical protein
MGAAMIVAITIIAAIVADVLVFLNLVLVFVVDLSIMVIKYLLMIIKTQTNTNYGYHKWNSCSALLRS